MKDQECGLSTVFAFALCHVAESQTVATAEVMLLGSMRDPTAAISDMAEAMTAYTSVIRRTCWRVVAMTMQHVQCLGSCSQKLAFVVFLGSEPWLDKHICASGSKTPDAFHEHILLSCTRNEATVFAKSCLAPKTIR